MTDVASAPKFMKVNPLDSSRKVMRHEQRQKTVGMANGRIRAYALRTVNPMSGVTELRGRVWREGVIEGGWRKLKRRRSAPLAAMRGWRMAVRGAMQDRCKSWVRLRGVGLVAGAMALGGRSAVGQTPAGTQSPAGGQTPANSD